MSRCMHMAACIENFDSTCVCVPTLENCHAGCIFLRVTNVLHATIQRIAPFLRHVHHACLIQGAQRILDVR